MLKSFNESIPEEQYPQLLVLVGLQGSGKSTFTNKEDIKNNYIILSSDRYRKEHPEWTNESVFKNLYIDMNDYLSKGKDVVIDATNITNKSRRNLLSNVKVNCFKKCLIFNTPYETCIERVKKRNEDTNSHKVPLEVLNKYLKSFEIPFKEEGWDYIEIYNHPTLEETNDYENQVIALAKNFNQNNKHHTKMLGEHMQDVANTIFNLSLGRTDKKQLLKILTLSGAYHDVGKLFTRTYKEGDPNAHYYNHANVGAYYLMCRCGVFYPQEDCITEQIEMYYSNELTIEWLFYINYHMHMYNIQSEKSIKKWKGIFGETKWNFLQILNKADKGEK